MKIPSENQQEGAILTFFLGSFCHILTHRDFLCGTKMHGVASRCTLNFLHARQNWSSVLISVCIILDVSRCLVYSYSQLNLKGYLNRVASLTEHRYVLQKKV